MKTAYIRHAECTGKVLPEGCDMANLAKPTSPRGAKGMQVPVEEDPNYHPVPIKHLNRKTMGLKQIEKYMIMIEKEVKEINRYEKKEMQESTPEHKWIEEKNLKISLQSLR